MPRQTTTEPRSSVKVTDDVNNPPCGRCGVNPRRSGPSGYVDTYCAQCRAEKQAAWSAKQKATKSQSLVPATAPTKTAVPVRPPEAPRDPSAGAYDLLAEMTMLTDHARHVIDEGLPVRMRVALEVKGTRVSMGVEPIND